CAKSMWISWFSDPFLTGSTHKAYSRSRPVIRQVCAIGIVLILRQDPFDGPLQKASHIYRENCHACRDCCGKVVNVRGGVRSPQLRQHHGIQAMLCTISSISGLFELLLHEIT